MTNGNRVSQKTSIVTGGSRGLGRNTAINLAERGADVIITYHSNKDEADKVVTEIEGMGRKAAAFQLDTGDISAFDGFVGQVKETLSGWGRERFDYLVNNAGIGLRAPFAETTEEDLDNLYRIHFKGVFFLTQKLLPLLADGGRIVNLSSGLARFSLPGMSAYASMKGAVEVLTRYLAKELGDRGIAVNTVAPGAIATDFGGGVVRDNQEMNDRVASMTAMGRAGLPDDIGPMIADLLTGGNRWVTGQRIEVSGGMLV
ncbi:3-oxoacyl-[acyl-carrier-protein] reductase FabG [Methyloligella halotolerans]|uniref:3-oxoacyl-[acyl-carrier-protein] reductase FabG n=1 Tax=Methyloligella halotolerans TaxID=1177755 RepID=A0A1E2S0W8_9HYPH|nr:SDR family oxidoreductase [Methyloligella halotolerans]ODA68104.1 3-oxoacyl-[acyl-carrier-protein] reductase FabG [Methyloligella halotolerans]